MWVCSARVLDRIRDALEKDGTKVFGLRTPAFIEVNDGGDNSGVVTVSAIRTSHSQDVGSDVLKQIRFWVKQEGLDQVVKV